KRAEQLTKESEERFRNIFNQSPIGIGVYNADGGLVSLNPAAIEMFGITSPEKIVGRTLFNSPTIHEEARRKLRNQEQIREEVVYDFDEIRHLGFYETTRTGVSYFDRIITPLRSTSTDEPFGYLSQVLDITERKRTEGALAQAMQELQMHIDNSPLAVIAFDPEFRIIEWSAGAERMFGWRAEEVLNKAIPDLRWVHEDDVERVASLSADMLAGRASSSGHANRNYRKDGSVIECEWYNSAIVDAQGKLISVRSQVLNVTERKRAEDALYEHQKQLQLLNETLEQKVHEKTEEVRRLASDLIQAVQHERHRISHILHDDLQQRIYAIQMQLTFLHDELQRENKTAGKEISDIEQQLTEILVVTRHLSIDLSPPILRDEGLSHAIGWLAAQMRQRYGLPIELQADGPFAISDEALHVLLFNCVRELLFNVVKHAQASRAVVKLQWVEAGLQIEVRDDGRGFPVDMPEQRASEEMNETNGLRSGWGLPAIRHQLDLFGGRMEIQSEPGAGARVLLIIPVVEGA
ncbi:MAG TPA: PAS domain S-box protein, partial [Anaerolineales bacterium]|nr:PAS domain S-box protein [Anaerolineales bacterium]